MKKSLVALTLAASLGLAACSNPSDEVVVSTSYGDITQGQFYDQIKSIAGTQLLEEVVIKQSCLKNTKRQMKKSKSAFNHTKIKWAINLKRN